MYCLVGVHVKTELKTSCSVHRIDLILDILSISSSLINVRKRLWGLLLGGFAVSEKDMRR